MATFPPEILDRILSFLRADIGSLKACSRAHPFLCNIAQPHLFGNVRVHNYPRTMPNMFTCSELFNALKSEPHIAHYIYELAFDLVYIESVEDITSVLSMNFPNLVAVELAGTSEPWRFVCEPFRASFVAFLGLPSIREVTIKRVQHFPLAELDRCKRLVKLKIDGHFTFSRLGNSPRPNPDLESLSIYHRCTGCLPGILTWAKLLNLRHLDISPSYSSAEDFSLLFQSCPSIMNLGLDLRHDCNSLYMLPVITTKMLSSARTIYRPAATPPVSTNLNLSALINLKELTFHAFVYLSVQNTGTSDVVATSPSSTVRYESSIPTILRLFKTAPSTKHLTLRLFFTLEKNATISDIPDWCELTSFFVDPPPNSLQCIDLYVSARKMARDLPPSEILPSLQEDPALRELSRRGVLIINPEVHVCRFRNCCDPK